MDIRAKAVITGTAALLAVLTLIMTIKSGAFSFVSENKTGDEKSFSGITALPVSDEILLVPVNTATPPTPAPPAEERPRSVGCTVTGTSGKGGRVTPSGPVGVPRGAAAVFSIIPDEGYVISEIRVDGIIIEVTGEYIFEKITSNHTLHAEFKEAEEEREEDSEDGVEGYIPGYAASQNIETGGAPYDEEYGYDQGEPDGVIRESMPADAPEE